MVTEEVRRAKHLYDISLGKKPIILPIRVNFPFTDQNNYDLDGYLQKFQQRHWLSDEDTPKLLNEIFDIISSGKISDDPALVKSPNLLSSHYRAALIVWFFHIILRKLSFAVLLY
jgi:hypothetical protein